MIVKESEETKEHGRKHTTYRLIILLAVFIIVIGGIIFMNQEKVEDQGLKFTYVGAIVELDDPNNITISFTNNSSQFNAKVIGISSEGKEVEFKSSNLCSDNITFNIEELLKDEMEIWIEIENIGERITEKQMLVSGDR